MKWVLAMVYLLAAAAEAGGYADFGAAIDANNRGEAGVATILFSRALAAGNLPDSYIPAALLGRARAQLRLHRCADAVRDLDSAIARKPVSADAYSLRAEGRQCLGNGDAALDDASQAVRLRPAAGYYFTRSRLLWNRGALASAHDDAEAAAVRDPGNAYFRLWSAVTAAALHHPATETSAPLTGPGDWPQPLIELYGGRVAPEAVWQAAADDNGRACEADFYIGAWFAARGQHSMAKDLYTRATARCPRDFVAFEAASSALKRLN